jgi:hypothetical protein
VDKIRSQQNLSPIIEENKLALDPIEMKLETQETPDLDREEMVEKIHISFNRHMTDLSLNLSQEDCSQLICQNFGLEHDHRLLDKSQSPTGFGKVMRIQENSRERQNDMPIE